MSYNFITDWQTHAPLADAWSAIYKSEEWPLWWEDVIEVKEIKHGDDRGIGSIRMYTLKSPMWYKLTFQLLLTDRVDHRLLSGSASGDLEGTGTWHFDNRGGITHIQCRWNVRTNVIWMNSFAFLLRPVFRYNHKRVMDNGAKCLAKKLSAPVFVAKEK